MNKHTRKTLEQFRAHYDDADREPFLWEKFLWAVCVLISAVSFFLLITTK
jgi:hypothetical protein